jgi:hypothetical protein
MRVAFDCDDAGLPLKQALLLKTVVRATRRKSARQSGLGLGS